MKHFIADSLGNYLFFAPIVIALTPALHTTAGAAGYLVAAIPIALLGGRAYTAFLKRVWYPVWRIKF